MANILKGGPVAARIRQEVSVEVAAMTAAGERPPGLAVVMVGDDPASAIYVANKTKACAEVGMFGRAVQLDAAVDATELLAQIDELNADPTIDGMLVQLPIPEQLPVDEVTARIDPHKDVDGLHPESVGRLWLGQEAFVPATPAGILELLLREDVDLEGRHAVVVGRSNIVGKPMASLLLGRHCTVTLCHSRTRDLEGLCRQADLLIAAVGRTALIGAEHVKEGAIVIDVGINRVSDPGEVERLFPGDAKRRGTLEKRGSVVVGDVDFTRVKAKAGAITPVPGGVGPLTIAMLLANTLKARRARVT